MYSDERTIKTSTFDWATILMYVAMVAWGWLAIYAADYNPNSDIFSLSNSYGRQIIWISLAFVVALVILLLDHTIYPAFAYIIYGVVILALVSLFFLVTKTTKGALSWFEIGSFKFQPSEFAKFATALALAKYLSTYGISFKDRKTQLICFSIFLFPMLLILLQNDTGSAMVFAAFILVLYREGLSGFWLSLGVYIATLFLLVVIVKDNLLISLILLGLGVLIFLFIRKNIKAILILLLFVFGSIGFIFSVGYIYDNALKQHHRDRIEVTLGLKQDDRGVGYNVNQSKIAIGSGGFYGKGFLGGTQTKLRFVPEQNTDFIFCTIGEEYGFIGSFFLVVLYISLLVRLVQIAERQRSRFNRVYAYCVVSILFFHFAINIGMTIGVFPVVGIPLPFFSYGGSSLLSFTIMLFILLRLDSNRGNEIKRSFEI